MRKNIENKKTSNLAVSYIGYYKDGNPSEMNPKQSIFHNCRDSNSIWKTGIGHVDEVFYGGAAGGGKTAALALDAIIECFINPPNSVMCGLFRSNKPELERTLIKEVKNLCPAGSFRYNGQKHVLTFTLEHCYGNQIHFCYGESVDQIERDYKSVEFTYIGVDEASHFKQEMVDYLRTRNRSSSKYVKAKFRLCSNPGNIGHGWLKKQFVQAMNPMQIVPFKYMIPGFAEITKTRLFIPATIKDNRVLMENDPSYVANIYRLGSDAKVRQLLYGDWDVAEGQYFTEWDYRYHSCDDFLIPSNWKRYRAIDWGYFPDPAICIWFAVSETGRVFAYRLFKTERMIPKDFGKTVVDLSKDEKIEWTVVDRNCNKLSHTEHGVTITSSLNSGGLYDIILSDSSRVPGWLRVHELLQINGEQAGLVFFKGACKDAIEAIPACIHDPNNSEDIKQVDDHIPDAVRYFCKMYFNKAKKEDRDMTGLDPNTRKVWETVYKQKANRNKAYDPVLGGLL